MKNTLTRNNSFPKIQKIEIRKDSSFDRRKHTDKIESTPLPLDDFVRNYQPSDTPVVLNYYPGIHQYLYIFTHEMLYLV